MNSIIVAGKVNENVIINSNGFDDNGNELRTASYDILVPEKDGQSVMHVLCQSKRAVDWAEQNAKSGTDVVVVGTRQNVRNSEGRTIHNAIAVAFDGFQTVGTAPGLNVAMLRGRLTADPTVRNVNIGGTDMKIADFTVAVDRNRDQADFFRVSAYRRSAEFVEKWFHKGSMIIVKGDVVDNSYTDRSGNPRESDVLRASTVEFGSTKKDESKQ